MPGIVTLEPQDGQRRVPTRADTAGGLLEQVAPAAAVLCGGDLIDVVRRAVVGALPVDGCEVGPVPLEGALTLPLVARGDTMGVLSLSSDTGPVRLSSRQWRELQAVAGILALALRHARLEQAAHGGLAAVAVALNSAGSLPEVVVGIEAAYRQMLRADSCSTTVLSGDLDRVPGIVRRPGAPTVFPLRGNDKLLGYVAAERHSAEPFTPDELETGQSLADLAAEAVARVTAIDRLRLRLHAAEARLRLAQVAAGSGGLTGAVRELNRILPAELGIRVRSISLANAQLRALLGGRMPDTHELEMVRSWRSVLGKGGRVRPRPVPNALLVPLVHRAKVLGVLRVSPADGHADGIADLLLAVGAGCAELVHKAGLQQHLAESERRLAVAAERDRIAQDLHDSVGQLITGMGMRLAQYVADAPDKVWRARLEELLHLAGRGSREVRQSVYALLFLDAKRGGLQASVRELCRRFEITTGIPVRFLVRGAVTPLAAPKEDALFRAAHEALVNVERHARASLATVQLTYEDGSVSLSVRDDGVGLGHRDPFGRSGHFGIRAMQRRLEDAGGELHIRNATPRGVLVEAVITRRKRTAHAAGTRRRNR